MLRPTSTLLTTVALHFVGLLSETSTTASEVSASQTEKSGVGVLLIPATAIGSRNQPAVRFRRSDSTTRGFDEDSGARWRAIRTTTQSSGEQDWPTGETYEEAGVGGLPISTATVWPRDHRIVRFRRSVFTTGSSKEDTGAPFSLVQIRTTRSSGEQIWPAWTYRPRFRMDESTTPDDYGKVSTILTWPVTPRTIDFLAQTWPVTTTPFRNDESTTLDDYGKKSTAARWPVLPAAVNTPAQAPAAAYASRFREPDFTTAGYGEVNTIRRRPARSTTLGSDEQNWQTKETVVFYASRLREPDSATSGYGEVSAIHNRPVRSTTLGSSEQNWPTKETVMLTKITPLEKQSTWMPPVALQAEVVQHAPIATEAPFTLPWADASTVENMRKVSFYSWPGDPQLGLWSTAPSTQNFESNFWSTHDRVAELWDDFRFKLWELACGHEAALDYLLRLPLLCGECVEPVDVMQKGVCKKLKLMYDANSDFSRGMRSEAANVHTNKEDQQRLRELMLNRNAVGTAEAFKRAAMQYIKVFLKSAPRMYLRGLMLTLRKALKRSFTDDEVIYLLTPSAKIAGDFSG